MMLAHRHHVLSETFFGPAPAPAWFGAVLVAIGALLLWLNVAAPMAVIEHGGLIVLGAVLIGIRVGWARDEIRRQRHHR